MKQQILVLPLMILGLFHCSEVDRGDKERLGPEIISLRVATWNIEDIRTTDLTGEPKDRLIAAAQVIQKLRPDILLVNEMSYDMLGVPGYDPEAGPGSNAKRFVEGYLGQQWVDALDALHYTGWMPPTNTGIASGYDLDNSGTAVSTFPVVGESDALGRPPRQTAEGRAFGNDAWGFGTFPGQYGMALFVRDGLVIDTEAVQTFQTFRWASLDSAAVPVDPDGVAWYSQEEWRDMRLSSKNHAVIPVELPDGRTLSIVASHPTPPAFDGAEMRNKKRNHDEIRLLYEIVAGRSTVLSDQGAPSRLAGELYFVVMGDLNADVDEGSAFGNPIEKFINGNARLNTSFAPEAADSTLPYYPDLDPDDTAAWGLRADYVIPSVDLEVTGSGVFRLERDGPVEISDHFPVWVDITVPVPTHE